MPLRMFELLPGRATHYRVVPVLTATWTDLVLEARRPDEGLSVELELRLCIGGGNGDGAARELARGRVPLDRGYLAVIREVERQVEHATGRVPSPDFELVWLDGPSAEPAAEHCARAHGGI